ncbi:hypothetical protein [Dehalogenimonas etheniformans]|uniref:Uncharacterized protein n=1 Tax=Dehalogenimonas etheniformans TaxID=1536648 RepID=A0A2P5P6T9_9CHLR|nr:hypothetical protein [Dehalogenimonas etheniformans]PPD58021.1 hypothetical protein JP09_006945 [Dehalogenimonas etheniformans]QNT75371.1 hypothetical protein HX448_01030 [Dehalogenimonas etheniformans]
MHELSPSLLAAQQSPSREGFVSFVLHKHPAWKILCTGTEEDCLHAATFAGDGSIIRARLGNVADSRKLYFQRIAAPDETSNFSVWTYTGEYNAVAIAVATLGAEVSILWIKSDRSIRRIKSTDYGATFGAAELVDYSPTTSCGGLSMAYKPNGDLVVFYADQATLYVKEELDNVWQPRTAWNKTTDALTGISCAYDGDFNLVITGCDTSGNCRLWSLVYGDGSALPAGTWGDLKEIATSPAAEGFEFCSAFLDKSDVYHCAYVEKFTGDEAYSRVYLTSTVPGASFDACLWTEPQPMDITGDYGVSIAHSTDSSWLCSANSVRRAPVDACEIDLTSTLIAARYDLTETGGKAVIELDNSNLGPSPAAPGDEVIVSPGYITDDGAETSEGLSFTISRIERSNGKILIEASDGWQKLKGWRAKNLFRWNASASITSIKDIIAWVVGRVGLRLEVVLASDTIETLCPDFCLNPGADGFSAVRRLLSMVPDRLFIEGSAAYLKNPVADEGPGYAYGSEHGFAACLLAESSIVSTCEIATPNNCGQQLYDVIEVTDEASGLSAARYRVTGIALDYRPMSGKYKMKLSLCLCEDLP